MTSSFTWLDHSEASRRRMLEAVQLFREKDTLDEVGVGGIRDAFSERLFPSMSVLHTRARYLLFVPWVYRDIESQRVPSGRAPAEARKLFGKLRDALVLGEPDGGVIGRRAGEAVRILPSTAYWNALGSLAIRATAGPTDRYYRSLDGFYARLADAPPAEDGEAVDPVQPNWHPTLPPKPLGLYEWITFSLEGAEAAFLRDQMVSRLPGSLLAHLLLHPEAFVVSDAPWEVPLQDADPSLVAVIDMARRFSVGISGATLLYNLLVAREIGSDEQTELHRLLLAEWHERVREQDDLSIPDWDAFWSEVLRGNPNVSSQARRFVEEWWGRVIHSANDPSDDPSTARLIYDRERSLKGGLARLGPNGQRQRELWGGGGTGLLLYRWGTVRQIVQDICDGLARVEIGDEGA